MSNNRLDILTKKQKEIGAALAAEKIKRAKQAHRDTQRLQSLIGAACVKHAAAAPDFHLMLKQMLGNVVLEDKARQFLANRGWL
jgi:hypothetical protein